MVEIERERRRKLIYCSSPARLAQRKEDIMSLVASQGNGGLHPFNAFPYEYFEGGVIGREKTIELCCRLIDVCDEFWLFGISEGTLTELRYYFEHNTTNPKPLKVFRTFDSEWQTYANLYSTSFNDVLKKLEAATLKQS